MIIIVVAALKIKSTKSIYQDRYVSYVTRYEEKISTRQELNTFFGRIHFYFPPISNIRLFLKNHKNVYFSNLFGKTELAKSHSLWIFKEFGE